MAADGIASLARAFSGIGVDEKAMVSILGKLHPQQRQSFRKDSLDFFVEDERHFERWDDRHILLLQHEFLRLKDAIVIWTMHPWERDARLLKNSLHDEPQYNVLIEITCTRSSDELLGARRAYHSLFDHSIEEDAAFCIRSSKRKLLVALLSSYRYEGPKVDDGAAKIEAEALLDVVRGYAHAHHVHVTESNGLIEDEEVVRILSTRSILHLKAIYKHYKELSGHYLDEDLDGLLRQTVECLCTPEKYFVKALNLSLSPDAHEIAKQGLSRIIVTRADVDIKKIKEEYHQKYSADLPAQIEEVANGNYRDFLLTLIARGD